MKQGGQSWNGSINHKRGVLTQCVCSICGRRYKMLHSKEVHERLCKEYNKNGK